MFDNISGYPLAEDRIYSRSIISCVPWEKQFIKIVYGFCTQFRGKKLNMQRYQSASVHFLNTLSPSYLIWDGKSTL